MIDVDLCDKNKGSSIADVRKIQEVGRELAESVHQDASHRSGGGVSLSQFHSVV